jgi:hypothetical protein
LIPIAYIETRAIEQNGNHCLHLSEIILALVLLPYY